MKELNCNGCRTCCIGDTIHLRGGDDASKYQTVEGLTGLQLAKGLDGNCIYLTKEGCSIHDDAPQECKAFDCRKYEQMFQSWDVQKRMSRSSNPRIAKILSRGRELLREEQQ
jgi:Fe-S-cluster containining protein